MKKRKSREEKVIESSSKVIKDLKNLYNEDGIAITEYKKLLDSYKKLLKRFGHMININDTIEKSVIVNNETLKNTVNHTIETAREKLLYNVAEHRKTKETLSKILESEKNSAGDLTKQLKVSYERISQLEKELEEYKKNSKIPEVQSVFEKIEIGVPRIPINMPQYQKFTYKELLENEIKKAKLKRNPLFLVKLTIDNFEKIRDDIQEQGDISNFLKSNVKYISITMGKNIIVYFSHHNIFYIIFSEQTQEKVQQKLENLIIKRKIGNIPITYSMGYALFDLDLDDYESINKKCDDTNEKASFDNQQGSIILHD